MTALELLWWHVSPWLAAVAVVACLYGFAVLMGRWLAHSAAHQTPDDVLGDVERGEVASVRRGMEGDRRG
jgi:hypothetical protein